MKVLEDLEKTAKKQKRLSQMLRIGGVYDSQALESTFIPVAFLDESFRVLRKFSGEMYKFKINKPGEYKLMEKGEVVSGWKQLERAAGDDLLRYAASIMGIFGAGLLIASRFSITGNIIGANENVSMPVAGIILILIAIALFFDRK